MADNIKLDDLTQNPTCTECGETVNIPRGGHQMEAQAAFAQRHASHTADGAPDGGVSPLSAVSSPGGGAAGADDDGSVRSADASDVAAAASTDKPSV